VTSITNGGRLVAFVTIYAPLHLYGLLDQDDLLLHDVAVTTLALDLCHRVLAVAEENKVGQFVEAARRNFSICGTDVTHFALLRYRGSLPRPRAPLPGGTRCIAASTVRALCD
jgi:hypothetical protein